VADAEETVSLLDRISSAASGEQRASDVQGYVGTHQDRIPLAYVSQSVMPDPAGLSAFMNARLDDINGLVIYKAP
jgi:hypothetical protein